MLQQPQPANNILTTQVLRRGVYLSFQEYKANRPGIKRPKVRLDSIAVKSNSKKNTTVAWHYILKGTLENGDPLPADYWGYCSGTKIYYKLPGGLYMLPVLNRGIYTVYAQPETQAIFAIQFNSGQVQEVTDGFMQELFQLDAGLKSTVATLPALYSQKLALLSTFNQRNTSRLTRPFKNPGKKCCPDTDTIWN